MLQMQQRQDFFFEASWDLREEPCSFLQTKRETMLARLVALAFVVQAAASVVVDAQQQINCTFVGAITGRPYSFLPLLNNQTDYAVVVPQSAVTNGKRARVCALLLSFCFVCAVGVPHTLHTH